MNIHTMRVIDHYLGNLVCYILSKVDLIRKIFIKPRNEIGEILVTKYFGLGSILLSGPMFRALRHSFPEAKITFLTFYNNREICQKLDFADNYLYLRNDTIYVFIKDLLRVLWEFRRHIFNIAIDMEFFSKFSAIVAYLSSARQRVGFYVRNEPRTRLYTDPISFNCYKHISEIFLALVKEVGADTEDMSLYKIQTTEEEEIFIKTIFSKYKISQFKKVIINVNAGNICLERRWPKKYFISLINLLLDYPDIYFMLIGTKEESSYVNSVIDSLDNKERVINLAGEMNIGEFLALLRKSDLFITNDSGPLHLAELTNIKTISFFGPETPVIYGPKSAHHIVFYNGLYCSPCLNVYNVKTAMHGCKRCFEGLNICMYSITVEEVFAKAKQILHIN
jgi:ADP-heptose:LPS heptosyltransferase